MNRRHFLLAGAAFACLGAAPPFRPTRFTVEVTGEGPDVLLIPGLTTGREVWRATVASAPGYRYHLLQVAGFAGAPPPATARARSSLRSPTRSPATS